MIDTPFTFAAAAPTPPEPPKSSGHARVALMFVAIIVSWALNMSPAMFITKGI